MRPDSRSTLLREGLPKPDPQVSSATCQLLPSLHRAPRGRSCHKMNQTPALPGTPISLQVRTILMSLAETCCLHGDKCVTQSDRDTRLQLVLRRRVWFWQGVPTGSGEGASLLS